jgi:uncharacterized protein YjbI with pentapeptide repeats
LKLVFEPIIKIKNIFSFELNRIFGNQGNSQLERSSLICFGISLFACFVSFWTIADMPIYPINLRIENINQTQDKDNHNELRNERELYLPWKAANKISNVKIIGKTNEALILDKSTIHNLDLSKLEIEEIPKNLFIIKAMDEFFVSYMKIWQDLLNNTGQWFANEKLGDSIFKERIKEMENFKKEFIKGTYPISLRGATISGTIKFPSNVKVDLTNADLTEANLIGIKLIGLFTSFSKDDPWDENFKRWNCNLTVKQLSSTKSLWNTSLESYIRDQLVNQRIPRLQIIVCYDNSFEESEIPELKRKFQELFEFPSKELIEDADIKLEEIIENEDLSDADLIGSEWISDKSIFCKASKFPAKEKIPKEVLEVIQNKCPDKLTK